MSRGRFDNAYKQMRKNLAEERDNVRKMVSHAIELAIPRDYTTAASPDQPTEATKRVKVTRAVVDKNLPDFCTRVRNNLLALINLTDVYCRIDGWQGSDIHAQKEVFEKLLGEVGDIRRNLPEGHESIPLLEFMAEFVECHACVCPIRNAIGNYIQNGIYDLESNEADLTLEDIKALTSPDMDNKFNALKKAHYRFNDVAYGLNIRELLPFLLTEDGSALQSEETLKALFQSHQALRLGTIQRLLGKFILEDLKRIVLGDAAKTSKTDSGIVTPDGNSRKRDFIDLTNDESNDADGGRRLTSSSDAMTCLNEAEIEHMFAGNATVATFNGDRLIAGHVKQMMAGATIEDNKVKRIFRKAKVQAILKKEVLKDWNPQKCQDRSQNLGLAPSSRMFTKIKKVHGKGKHASVTFRYENGPVSSATYFYRLENANTPWMRELVDQTLRSQEA